MLLTFTEISQRTQKKSNTNFLIVKLGWKKKKLKQFKLAASPEELEDLPDLGRDLVDAPDPHDVGKLGVGGHVVVALGLGLALEADLVALLVLQQDRQGSVHDSFQILCQTLVILHLEPGSNNSEQFRFFLIELQIMVSKQNFYVRCAVF